MTMINDQPFFCFGLTEGVLIAFGTQFAGMGVLLHSAAECAGMLRVGENFMIFIIEKCDADAGEKMEIFH